tara:strand:+ start:318 stop:689 length:372 start_codon:yes stop_codon:yes gene_type:complete
MPDVTNNKKVLQKKQRDEDKIKENSRHAWTVALKSKEGRVLLGDILALTGLYRSSFTGNSETFKLEGQRNVGLAIKKIMESYNLQNYYHLIVLEQEKEPDKVAAAARFEKFISKEPQFLGDSK